jgi:hypothetical protein
MTPVQTTPTLERAPGTAPPQPSPQPVVLTCAETAECTCPEYCERDHELD